ncbi:MAG: type II toxin-antitoxin system CcdA family antitoxin [Propioniciclava sp.]|uniref:type II toxin-antitoxin system CcdA family antitoxin n=1 Tax=Propioniciclava sp. TaxID=2038686 RepID=UPI0039E59607
MVTKKITITLPEELVEAARGLTDNLSGYAAEALAAKIRHALLGQELDRHEQEHGFFSEADIAAAEGELFGEKTSAGAA